MAGIDKLELTSDALKVAQTMSEFNIKGAATMFSKSIINIIDKPNENSELLLKVTADFLIARAYVMLVIHEDHEKNGESLENFSMREQYPADEEHMISDFPVALTNLLEQDNEIGKVTPSELRVMLIAALMHDYDRTTKETAVFKGKGMTREEQKNRHVKVSLEESLKALERLGIEFSEEEAEFYKEIILNHHNKSEEIEDPKVRMFADLENLTFFGAIASDYVKPERHSREASLMQLVTKYEALPDHMKVVADKLIGDEGPVCDMLKVGLSLKTQMPVKWEEIKNTLKNQKM